MKYTNIKKLLIKFMGGGLINFPTRFLRWIKIDGDAEGDDGGSSGDSTEVDYEAIYQFYKKEIVKIVPGLFLKEAIIPEHFIDIEDGTGDSDEYANKFGIWKGTNIGDRGNKYLFTFIGSEESKFIYFGQYNSGDEPNAS